MPGADLHQLDGVNFALVGKPLSDITAKTPRQLSVCGSGIDLCLISRDRSGDHDPGRLFSLYHSVDLGIDVGFCPFPLLLFLPVILEPSEIVCLDLLRLLDIPFLGALRVY